MKSRFPFVIVALLSCYSLAFAQKPPTGGGGGNTGGNTGGGTRGGLPSFNTGMGNEYQPAELQVRISWAQNERPLEESLHVQLLNATNVPVQDTFSTRDGTVTFHAVSPGNYHLKVDGPEIEEMVTPTFSIYDRERMHNEWVHVVPKKDANGNGAPGGMVSAAELNIPPKAKSEMDKGMEAFEQGDLKKAKAKLEKALEIYPKYSRAWNNLAVVRMKENDKAGAKEAWIKSVEADNKFVPGYLNLARFSMMEKDKQATEDYLNKALAIDPNNTETLVLLSREELLSQQYDKALAHARKVHGLPHEHYADVHLIAGEALLHENQNAAAVQEYETYLKEYPDSPNAGKVRAAMAQIQARKN
jgi:tetratricopeptide (TPR) repeat protein